MTITEYKQFDMFKGTLVDNRTRTQKEADKARATSQNLMFSQRDMAQFGVNANPLFPLSPKMLLPMMMEDPRTEEEIEADRIREAQRLTIPLFPPDEPISTISEPLAETPESKFFPTIQPPTIPHRPTPPAPPGLFAVEHRFTPPSETPKPEKIIYSSTPKPLPPPVIKAQQAETDESDTKNEAFCRVAVTAQAFERRDKRNHLTAINLLWMLMLADSEADAAGITNTEITLAHRIGQVAATHTAIKDR